MASTRWWGLAVLAGGIGLIAGCSLSGPDDGGNPSGSTASAWTRPASTTENTASAASTSGADESVDGPSQTLAEAERDGVVPALAELPMSLRVNTLASVAAEEGLWVISRPPEEAIEFAPGCGLGDPDGVYGRDVICVVEYGEVLLMSEEGTEIVRAFPLPGHPPQHLVVTDDGVYCGRQGDGALPDSMVCRIDRQTLEWAVRVLPLESGTTLASGLDPDTLPDNWTVDEPFGGALLEQLMETDDGIVASGRSGRSLVDPATLELLPIP